MSKKDYTHIKANGLRNELKDLRKAVEALTNVLALGLGVTNKHTHNEKDHINKLPDDRYNDGLSKDE